jgi:2-oxoglutarate ferredoxin oxidoreductase subunit alpha
MRDHTLNILIGGEAGQGLVTVGYLLAKSLVRSGYSIVVSQSYQSRIRGGHNTFAIRVSVDEVIAPKESVDLLVALDADTVSLHRKDLSADGLVVLDSAFDVDGDTLLKVPFGELTQARFSNIAALGVVGSLVGLDEALMATALDDLFGKKKPQLAEENRRALAAAMEWAAEQVTESFKLPSIPIPPKRLMMNANEAIALGALSAGLKFCAFYPMTPSTSIVLNLAAQAQRMGLIVEQAEDEIAAINMAIGARGLVCRCTKHGFDVRGRICPHGRRSQPCSNDRDPLGHRSGTAPWPCYRPAYTDRAGRPGACSAFRAR